MKPNEPKSSAAAACPAGARNTRESESEGERARQEREGGWEKEQDEIDRVESAENGARIHVGHSNSPASLRPARLLPTPRPILTLSLRDAVTPPPVMKQKKQGE